MFGMRLIIKTTNFSLTPSLRQYIEEKLGALGRLLSNIEAHDDAKLSGKRDPIEIRVEIGKPSQHHKHGNVYYAEVNVDLLGIVLRAESMQWDVHRAIDEVKDEMQRELKKYKERWRATSRTGARQAKETIKTMPSRARLARRRK